MLSDKRAELIEKMLDRAVNDHTLYNVMNEKLPNMQKIVRLTTEEEYTAYLLEGGIPAEELFGITFEEMIDGSN